MNFIFLLIILLLIYIGYKKIKKLNINTNIGKTTAILFGIWLYLMSLYGEEYLFAPFNAWLKSMGVDPRLFWLVIALGGGWYFYKKMFGGKK